MPHPPIPITSRGQPRWQLACRMPLLLIVLLSATIFLGLRVWGWGSFGGFVDHPARVGACVVSLEMRTSPTRIVRGD
jgi:hypothetical protein